MWKRIISISVLLALAACQPTVQQQSKAEHIVVRVDAEGQITLNGEKVSEEEAIARLERMSTETSGKPNQ